MLQFRKPTNGHDPWKIVFQVALTCAKTYFQDPVSAAENVPNLWKAIKGKDDGTSETIGWIFLQSVVTTAALLVLKTPRMRCELTEAELQENANSLVAANLPDSGALEPQDLTAPHVSAHLQNAIAAFPVMAKEAAPQTPFEPDDVRLRFEEALGRAVSLVFASSAQELEAIRTTLTGPVSEPEKREIAWRRNRAWIRAQFTEEPIFSPDDDVETPLSEVYMRLRCHWNESHDIERDGHDNLRYRTAHVADLHGALNTWLNTPGQDDNIRLVAGGPGCGKSSFAKAFAVETLNDDAWRVLFIRLHHMTVHDTLRDSIGRFLKESDGWKDLTKCEGFFENPLSWHGQDTRPLLLIFDGLDELTANEDREKDITRRFVNTLQIELNALCRAGHTARAIVLGREPAIEPALDDANLPLCSMINVAPIRPLSRGHLKLEQNPPDHQIGDGFDPVQDPDGLMADDERPGYWERWQRCKGKVATDIPPALTDARMKDLNVEPLLLHLLIISDFCGPRWEEAADNRNLVYNDILTKVFNRNKSKGLDAYSKLEKNHFFELMEVFGLAAFRGNGRTGDHANFLKLRTRYALPRHENKLYKDLDGAQLKNVALMVHARQEVDGAGFEFVHKSFGEYLAARALIGAGCLLARRIANEDLNDTEKDLALIWVQLIGAGEISNPVLRFLKDELRLRDAETLTTLIDTLTKVFEETLSDGFPVSDDPDLHRPTYRQLESHQRCAETAMLTLLTAARRALGIVTTDRETLGTIPLKAFTNDPAASSQMIDRLFSRTRKQGEIPTQLNYLSMPGAQLWGVRLPNAVLSGANLTGADLGRADLREADLREADLIEADLREAYLTGADLREAYLTGADLREANLRKANLTGADLREADLREANLTGADLREADLREADLTGADLTGADLREANLTVADLTGADLREADFHNTNLDDCIFAASSSRLADLTGSRNLTQIQLDSFFGVRAGIGLTRLPDGLSYPDFWHSAPDVDQDTAALREDYENAYLLWKDQEDHSP